MKTRFVYDDGGRKAAGYQGATGDCVTRAIAIATGLSYQDVYDRVNAFGKRERRGRRRRGGRSSARTGVHIPTTRRILESLGWTWTPTMAIGQGCQVHLRADELPAGRLVVSVSRHLVAVIDGVPHDTHDPTRDGKRCVYGYWRPPTPSTPPTRPTADPAPVLAALDAVRARVASGRMVPPSQVAALTGAIDAWDAAVLAALPDVED